MLSHADRHQDRKVGSCREAPWNASDAPRTSPSDLRHLDGAGADPEVSCKSHASPAASSQKMESEREVREKERKVSGKNRMFAR